MKVKVLLLDNYDSFTYNLYQYLRELGASAVVRRNDEVGVGEIEEMGPTHIVISPGPGRPEGAGISCEVVAALCRKVPILGVCLGHQAIGHVMGARITRTNPVHGKTSLIYHDSKTIFSGLPNPFSATRYHSLVVEAEGIPPSLEVSGRSEDDLVMSIRHRDLPLEGVQFHPESILTDVGRLLLGNFLRISAGGDVDDKG